LVLRARASGADYVFIAGVFGITSIRRFQKRGVVRQMLAWRRNHRDFARGLRERVMASDYEVIR
ncbi:MAG: hypothetical protein N3A66_08035, partial [Planctomycetota bacterium]|nr:hypothetical protein [Planctomycetota bacterium]